MIFAMRSYRLGFVLLTAALSLPAAGADRPRQLAVESIEFINQMEAMLDGAIRSGSPDDYNRFVFKPTLAQMTKWPPLSDESYLRYRRCQFAVDAFRNYADASFKEGARLEADSLTARDFAEQRSLCKQSIK